MSPTPSLTKSHLRPLVGDLRQYASVRRIVLDDGPERNVRALAFSTGGGLDFWVLSDRSLDIGPVWYRGMPVAWQSASGFRNTAFHRQEDDGGRGFNRSFSGFLVTCGLDHIRQPQGDHPLHGRFPFTPASLFAYGEDWDRDEPLLFCEGQVIQSRYGGEVLSLRRRIEAPIGGCKIRIRDIVENLAARPTPQELLYHFNLGFPAICTDTEVWLGARRVLGPLVFPDNADPVESKCYSVLQQATNRCTVRTPRNGGEFKVEFTRQTDSLPYLQVWKDLRPHAGVLAIEPCTTGKAEDGNPDGAPDLGPGDRREYHVAVAMSGQPALLVETGDQPQT